MDISDEKPAICEAIEGIYKDCPESEDGMHHIEMSINGSQIWCVDCGLGFDIELPSI